MPKTKYFQLKFSDNTKNWFYKDYIIERLHENRLIFWICILKTSESQLNSFVSELLLESMTISIPDAWTDEMQNAFQRLLTTHSRIRKRQVAETTMTIKMQCQIVSCLNSNFLAFSTSWSVFII